MIRPPSALVLFDIDGTLLRNATAQHKWALLEAARRVTGREIDWLDAPTHGMLDPQIVRQLLRGAGLPEEETQKLLPEILSMAQRLFSEACPDLTDKLCPGLPAALDRLLAGGAVLGLVTGNLSQIAWRKIERAGLLAYFAFGAFSEEAQDRGELARLAVARARERGWWSPETVVALVGDHPNDIYAARYAGARAIAVATGLSTREELEEAGPDVLLDDLGGLSLDLICENRIELPGLWRWDAQER